MEREISSEFATCTGRDTSSVAGTIITAGSRNATGSKAGRVVSGQHDMEHDVNPVESCPQSIGGNWREGTFCCVWW